LNLIQDITYKQIFKQLHDIAHKFDAAEPFAPFMPETWGQKNHLKTMWFGSAPYGWGQATEFKNIEIQQAETKAFFGNCIKEKHLGNQFWRIQSKICRTFGLTIDDVMWNNVYKIGSQSGEPSTQLAKAQMEHSIRAATIELKVYQPDLVVYHTGELANRILQQITGPWDSWDKVNKLSWVYPNSDTKTVWITRRRNVSDRDVTRAALRNINTLGICS